MYVIDSMKNYWLQKIVDCLVTGVLFLLLFWVLFPSYVKAAGPDVAGWVPWWIDDSGVGSVIDNMDEIDIIYPFVYEVEDGGGIVAQVDFDRGVWEDLLDEADDERVEVIPTIAWFDGEAIHAVLSDRRARNQLIDDIEELVDDNDFDGINIDFEDKWSETIDDYSRFLKDLNKTLGRDTLTCAIEARMEPEHRWRDVPAEIDYANGPRGN